MIPHKTHRVPSALALSLATALASGCVTDDRETLADPDPDDAQRLHADAQPARATPPHDAAAVHQARGEAHRSDAAPRAMPGAREAFDEVLALVEAHYVDGPLTQDELWTAAMDGVMARLVSHHGHAVNVLMRPEDLKELQIGMEGKLVGIGVMIETVADVVVVRGLVPDGPATVAGLEPGDRILGVDGQRLRGKSLRDVVDLIRGDADSTVELFVQRDTEEWNVTLTRSAIAYSNVESRMLGDDVGYVRIGGFSKETASDLDGALSTLSQAGMAQLVLDLRGCPGGILEGSLDVADAFLPPEKLVVTVQVPGKPDEPKMTATDDPWESVPMVVLADGKTASSAEIVAAALAHHRRARVVGQTTFGKDTIESIHELGDGWGLKLSVGRFETAGGADAHGGGGLRPHLSIPATQGLSRVALGEVDADADEQLRGAVQLLDGL